MHADLGFVGHNNLKSLALNDTVQKQKSKCIKIFNLVLNYDFCYEIIKNF